MTGEELFSWKAVKLCFIFGVINSIFLILLKFGADKLQEDMGGSIHLEETMSTNFVKNFLTNYYIMISVLSAIILKPILTWALSEGSPAVVYPMADFFSFSFMLIYVTIFFRQWIDFQVGIASLFMIIGTSFFIAGFYILIADNPNIF